MISHLVSLALVFALTDAVTTSQEGEPPPATHQVRKERMNATQTLVYPNELASSHTQRSSYVESIITDLESALLNPKPPSFPAGPEVK